MTERTAIWCGLLAPTITIGAILLATVVATPETFTWRGRALSDMGRVGTRSFLLFNGGLVAGGVIGLPFVWYLIAGGRNYLERLGFALVGVSVIGFVGVGVFFIGHTDYYLPVDLHGIAALTFFVSAPIAQWLVGTGQVLADDRLGAIVSFWSGIVQALGWIVWFLYRVVATDPMAWFAVPEFVAAAAFSAWILFLAFRAYKNI